MSATMSMSQKDSQGELQQQQQQQKNQEKKKPVVETTMFIPLIISFREICVVTALLPLVTLTVCFVTAYLFQADEVHETHCKVYNIIPSISAITGVSPQRYLWRVCIALHIGPRFAIAAVYRNFYRALNAKLVPAEHRPGINVLIKVVFVLHLVEIASLCCVTYVSNKENYPVHERFFITFMVTSLFHMLLTIKLLNRLQPWRPTSPAIENSMWWKKALFAASLASTAGLIIFFLKHRLLCHDLAFSFFAFCEYLIASANMGFHWTCTLDFPTEDCIIANCTGEIRALFERQFLIEKGGEEIVLSSSTEKDKEGCPGAAKKDL